MNETVETKTTRGDLARFGMDALDKDRAGAVAVSHVAGGVSFASALEVMEFAKLMAVGRNSVPPHLRDNPGACLRIVFQAIEWHMSPYAVADKSYEVNSRLAYESQLIHAIVEARAPLQKRLRCEYSGEGPTRRCKVIGIFHGEDEPHEYESPEVKDIKVKNSPLWTADPDQQLFYYASRSWARKWCPDVLMGIYTRDELESDPNTAGSYAETGMRARLIGRQNTGDGEGFAHDDAGSIASELDAIAPNAGDSVVLDQKPVEAAQEAQPQPATEAADGGKIGKGGKRKGGKKAAQQPADGQESAPEPASIETIKTADDYVAYAKAWIAACPEDGGADAHARWASEEDKRSELKVPVKNRVALREALEFRFGEA